MIIIAIALIVIAQKVASYFNRNRIELNEVTDLHCWSDLDTLLKVSYKLRSIKLTFKC